MNPNERAGGLRDSGTRRRNLSCRSQLCNDFVKESPGELVPLALRRARVAAAAGKRFPCLSSGGRARRVTVTGRPGRGTPIPRRLSSETTEAYEPLEVDKAVGNAIGKVGFP